MCIRDSRQRSTSGYGLQCRYTKMIKGETTNAIKSMVPTSRSSSLPYWVDVYKRQVLYESKLIGYPKPWKNKVRTFCQNPGGFVAQENYDNDLAVVNGHSFKEMCIRDRAQVVPVAAEHLVDDLGVGVAQPPADESVFLSLIHI